MAGVGGAGDVVTIKSEPTLELVGVQELVDALGDCDDVEVEVEEEEEDQVVREIDVYLAPALSATLNLVQFPLQPVHSASSLSSSLSVPHFPETARVRPRHGMLQLDYAVPASALNAGGGMSMSQIAQRTYDSYKVPVTTHLALGKLTKDGTRMDMVPIRAVKQMRPSFSHIDDAAAASSGGGGEEEEKKKQKKQDDDDNKLNATPLLFRRKESERAELARRSSYAYKRASEESEEWIEMEVCGQGSPAHTQALEAAQCPEPERELKLLHGSARDGAETPSGKTSLTVAYVGTLNYLPQGQGGDHGEEEEEEEEELKEVSGKDKKDTAEEGDTDAAKTDNDNDNDDDDKLIVVTPQLRRLTRKVAILLKTGAGIPTPYLAVRCRFPSSTVSDKMLVRALSACAALVRGNFVLRSNIIGLADETAAARDFILTLLNRDGIVFREALQKIYGVGDNSSSGGGAAAAKDRSAASLSQEVLNEILAMVARPGNNCMELLVQDDWYFEKQFPIEAEWHRAYWVRKEEEFSSLLCRYEEYSERPAS